LFGFGERDDLTGPGFTDLFGSAGALAFDITLDGRTPGEEIMKGAEFRATTRKGRMIDVEASSTVVQWKGVLTLQVTFRDITDRKVLEREQALWAWEQDALREIDKRLVGIADLGRILEAIILQVTSLSRAPWAGIIMFSESRNLVRWRAMAGHMRPFDADRRYDVTPSLLALFSATAPMILQELGDGPKISLSTLPGLEGEELISSVWLPLNVGGRVEGALAVGYRSFHSFSEREMRLLSSLGEKTSIAIANSALYENLLERERDLEMLSGARIDAQEEERRRIAREIHDGLGQILTAIKLNVEILEDSAEIRKQDRETLADVKNLLDTVMKEARDISYNLMPSVLVDFGLAPALQLLGERFSGQSGVKVEFYGKSEGPRLDPRMEVALYRIVQESLTNAVRHGEAKLITVQLSRTGVQLRLTIEDNGKGMDEERARIRRNEGGGIGLASMRERVSSFNGTITIDSSPGKGTLIIVDLPLEAEESRSREWQRSESS
jgi:PAS domain S-box-containing protein